MLFHKRSQKFISGQYYEFSFRQNAEKNSMHNSFCTISHQFFLSETFQWRPFLWNVLAYKVCGSYTGVHMSSRKKFTTGLTSRWSDLITIISIYNVRIIVMKISHHKFHVSFRIQRGESKRALACRQKCLIWSGDTFLRVDR